MPLIVLDHELTGLPCGVVHVLYERDTVSLQHLRGRGGVVGLEVQMEVSALIHECDGRVDFV